MAGNAFMDRVKRLDGFGQSFQFLLPDGQKTKKSLAGLFLTVTMIFLLIWYSLMQIIRLTEYGEPSIMVSERDSHFTAEFELTSEEGFMVAFGITAYDDVTESIDDPRYGRTKGVYKTWGQEDQIGVNFEEIPMKPCTRA